MEGLGLISLLQLINHISALAKTKFPDVLRQSLDLSDVTKSNQKECFQQYSPIICQE
jgi:hypothetical protein